MIRFVVRAASCVAAALGGFACVGLWSGCAADSGAAKSVVTASAADAATDADAAAGDAAGDADAQSVAILPAVGTSVRAGGDRAASADLADDEYRAGPCRIDTPLPEGYPAPTPPGAIDVKSYPAVRRAEVSGTIWPELGMNMAFFPLFNHIQRREIAMTSPVEMDYRGMSTAAPDERPEAWTMSFLYRYADQGPAVPDERDERISVNDAKPVTVVALGMRGSYGVGRVKEGLEMLAQWFEANPAWKAAGDARALYYNGPDVPNRNKWMEVQVPVEPAD